MRAAINLGALPASYKTQRCRAFDTKAGCPLGALRLVCPDMSGQEPDDCRICYGGSVTGLLAVES